MEELPYYARARHLQRYFGFTKYDLRKLIGARVLIARLMLGTGYTIFRREEVLAAVRAGKIERQPVAGGTDFEQKGTKGMKGTKARRR